MKMLFGWFCTLLHDFPEDEGIVWFNDTPFPGLRFKLPSSNYTEEWVVKNVDKENMSFTAISS
jgi:hypothetical protein